MAASQSRWQVRTGHGSTWQSQQGIVGSDERCRIVRERSYREVGDTKTGSFRIKVYSKQAPWATHCQTLSLSVIYNKSKLSSDWDEYVWGFIMQFSHLGGCKAIDTCYNSPSTRKKCNVPMEVVLSSTLGNPWNTSQTSSEALCSGKVQGQLGRKEKLTRTLMSGELHHEWFDRGFWICPCLMTLRKWIHLLRLQITVRPATEMAECQYWYCSQKQCIWS